MAKRRSQPARLSWPVRLVAVIPVAGALVLSFSNLADLARSARFDGWLAYLWPGTLDATGVVASLIWLDITMPGDARRAASRLALAAIALSIAGNSLRHWLLDAGQRPYVVVQMAIAAVPPAVLFLMLHVLHLAQRRPAAVIQPPASQPVSARPPVDQRGQDPARWPATGPTWTGRVIVIPAVTSHPLATSPRQPAGQPWLGLAEAGSAIPVNSATPTTTNHTGQRPANGHPVQPPGLPAATGHPATASQSPTPPPDPPTSIEPVSQQRPPARTGGQWRDHLDAATRIVADHPDIGRPSLASQLGIPTSQARKLLDHLATLKTGQR
ncbi:DUF2637 domain-containing protein [Actinocrispum wychmicini]|uniref:Uncharacterized protein DUF2637 n=1 Tax=Actinocrispum wychmicini TaxID=1213861 RepID=A0A4V2S6S3_9PSEU|nr:DUF2637 domain-containing protein [Actinocrispum wychmicini]TCO57180.1 uncharacterized protein DUF2637 [Actinocrispum wychmicini]